MVFEQDNNVFIEWHIIVIIKLRQNGLVVHYIAFHYKYLYENTDRIRTEQSKLDHKYPKK